ncbi:hypothetical protein [Vibrio sp. D431a]|uniref:hypothetical protein n=1 Tax=Vibrio sp. D431a TaxID=2837388 RepID=UPI002555C0BA|nr:hypothetical protein [Vibrio sp. D431a]MDK9793307.1 hypothetical protein [Vibrio sp. D431a]
MKEVIMSALKSLSDNPKYYPKHDAIELNDKAEFEKLCLKDILNFIKNEEVLISDILEDKSLARLFVEHESGSIDAYFDEEFTEFESNLSQKIADACRALNIEVEPPHNIAEIYTETAQGLVEAELIELCEVNNGITAKNIPVHGEVRKFDDFYEASSFLAGHQALLVFAYVKKVNNISTRTNNYDACVLVNNGSKIFAINLSRCECRKIKYLASFNVKECDSRPLVATDLNAVMMAALINQTNYLTGGKDSKKVAFGCQNKKQLPSVLKTTLATLNPIKTNDVLYSNSNPKYAWLDNHIDQNNLEQVLNLRKKNSEDGKSVTYAIKEGSNGNPRDISVMEITNYDSYKHGHHHSLLALDPSIMDSEENIRESQLKVARFNKAVVAELCLKHVYSTWEGIGDELELVLNTLTPSDVVSALSPIIKNEASQKLHRGLKQQLYKQSALLFHYTGLGINNLIESASKSSVVNYGSWRDTKKTPLLTVNGTSLNKQSGAALKSERCAINGRKATQFIGVSLNDHRALSALVEALPEESGLKLPNIAKLLTATKYKPKFENQSFNANSIVSLSDYPTNRDVEDYIRNPFFIDCILVIPLSNAGGKELGL